MFEQLPAADRHASDGWISTAGEQGPEGGAAAPSGPHLLPAGGGPDLQRLTEALPTGRGNSNPSATDTLGSHQGRDTGDITFAGVPVRAIEDVMACRTRQIVEFGHTPEKDRLAPLYTPREFDARGSRSLLRSIAAQLSSAIEYAAFGRGKHDIVRKYLVKTAALCLAAIDWIDADMAERGPERVTDRPTH